MAERNGINRLIYEYYEARILFGFYSYGESLPSISKISTMFGMAPATVRSGLAHLEKEGYIQVDVRKAAKVIYQASPEQFRKNSIEYFLKRSDGIVDILHSGQHMFGSLWEEEIRRCDEETLGQICTKLLKPSAGLLSMPAKFHILTLGGLNNGLILNLYWDTLRYLRFPYLTKREEEAYDVKDISGNSADEMIKAMRKRAERFYSLTTDKILDFITEARKEYMDDMEQIPFEWMIYRQRPQIRYTLVSQIIREIMSGEYPAGSYLPSLPEMAQKYGVALSTIRRTLHILDCLGIIRPYHGKGNEVCIEPGRLDCSEKDLREGMRLYRESLELLTLTIGSVSEFLLESISESKKDDLMRQLASLQKRKKGYLCFELYFTFIQTECPSAMIRECYRCILDLLAWGYPFALLQQKDSNLHQEYKGFVSVAVDCLKEGNYSGFIENWEALMKQEEQKFANYMKEMGI